MTTFSPTSVLDVLSTVQWAVAEEQPDQTVKAVKAFLDKK